MSECSVCFRHCKLSEGSVGVCGARACRGGEVVPLNYGRITGLALDPIEKKPLRRFHPGSAILSVGSYGCNLRCPFCQNSDISWGEQVADAASSSQEITPQQLVGTALRYKSRGNIGIAFTYNEPLIGYEFVRDTARLSHEAGLLNVIVSNGTATPGILAEIAPYIDAMNIDLKCFDADLYKSFLGGDLDMTMKFISEAVKTSHVELTCLIVPGLSDSPEMMRKMCGWIASLRDADGRTIGEEIPLHVSRFFPRFHMSGCEPTPVETVYELADVAREQLKYVYTGNC